MQGYCVYAAEATGPRGSSPTKDEEVEEEDIPIKGKQVSLSFSKDV